MAKRKGYKGTGGYTVASIPLSHGPLAEAIAKQGIRCKQCGAPMTPVEVLMGLVCGRCARKNHKAVTGAK